VRMRDSPRCPGGFRHMLGTGRSRATRSQSVDDRSYPHRIGQLGAPIGLGRARRLSSGRATGPEKKASGVSWRHRLRYITNRHRILPDQRIARKDHPLVHNTLNCGARHLSGLVRGMPQCAISVVRGREPVGIKVSQTLANSCVNWVTRPPKTAPKGGLLNGD